MSGAARPKSRPEHDGARALCARVVQELCALRPVMASAVGIHTADTELEGYGPAERAACRRTVGAALAELGRLRSGPAPLDPGLARDLRWLKARLLGLEHEIEAVRPFARNPDFYNELAGEAIYQVIARPAADPSARLRACVGRLAALPAHFASAELLLEDPPAALLRVAREQAERSLAFYEQGVPRAFRSARARRALAGPVAAAGCAVRRYAAFLERRIEASAGRNGQPGLGEDVLARYLATAELVAARPADLERQARGELRRARTALEEQAARLAGRARRRRAATSARAILEELGRDHPNAAQIIPELRGVVTRLRRFCRQAELVTVPAAAARCRVSPMPEYLTSLVVACMDVPGPFEAREAAAAYQVTLPRPRSAPRAAADDSGLAQFFNRAGMHWVTAHEAYPGHLVQMAALRQCASPVRRLFSPDTFVEGWAHYAEELVFEAGYGDGQDHLKLAKEHGALMRAARCVASLGLHCGAMSLSQAERLLCDEGLFPPGLARSEALRCAVDLSCFSYTIGKLGLLALRDEVRAAWGAGFTLRRFHDAILAEGQLPLALLREALLEQDRRKAIGLAAS
ncbi:MAG: DUF885 family protein [Deltaproteobacteria bacterium]|nr:DUF885 family protein [Deltaproteobacteria bacterium]